MQIKLSVKEKTLLFCLHFQKVEVALEEVEWRREDEEQGAHTAARVVSLSLYRKCLFCSDYRCNTCLEKI